MLISATLSKATSEVEKELGKAYEKIKIKIENSANGSGYFVEMFTKTQVFHKHFTEDEAADFLEKHAGKTFKNCVKRSDSQEITIMANKKGKITEIARPIVKPTEIFAQQDAAYLSENSKNIRAKGDFFRASESSSEKNKQNNDGLKILPTAKKKNYLLQEGVSVPFLVLLGVMTPEGKVIKAKYDKFRQINRFLEFLDDILPAVLALKKANGEAEENPVRVVDFGCGKSYLTFAVHYFLTEIKKIPCRIEGLDLKEDVINYCNEMTSRLGLKNLIFHTGNISDYSGKDEPDIVITLHACDTATDFALKYAVERSAKAILSVPCCQHQINQQLGKEKNGDLPTEFEGLLKWGIIREKFSALVTDSLRGQWLESKNYKVQMLEFIDMEHTPKNLLIRAVKNGTARGEMGTPVAGKNDIISQSKKPEILNALKIQPEIWKN